MEAGVLDFRPVILNILNRWMALKMVVDHQMGGRQSGEKALYLVEYLHQIFTSNQAVEAEDLEDLLVEYMDQEFSTVLEDESPVEVSRELVRLWTVFRSGGLPAAENELRAMPDFVDWLNVVPKIAQRTMDSDSGDSSDDMDQEEEEDPEWTKVRYGRKK